MPSNRIFLTSLFAFVSLILSIFPVLTSAAGEPHALSEPIFIQLEPITVNLQKGKSKEDNYAQVKISLETQDTSVAEAVNRYLPRIQSELSLLLSSKEKIQLETVTQKRLLAKEAAAIVNNIIKPRGTSGVTAVHFPSFMVQ